MSLYSLALLISATRALPAGSFNETCFVASVEAQSSDNYRTLWAIISSCLVTIFACVYTAIHPNIPSPYDLPPAILLRRAGIMLVAVIAPKLIVMWAARQWASARIFTKKMNDCLQELRDEQGATPVEEQRSSDEVIDGRNSSDSHAISNASTSDESENRECDTVEAPCASDSETQGPGKSGDELPLLRSNDSDTIFGVDDGQSKPWELRKTENLNHSCFSVTSPRISHSTPTETEYALVDDPDEGEEETNSPWKRKILSWLYAHKEDETWTTTHSFFAYMGGFMVYHEGEPWRTITPPNLLQAIKDKKISPIKLTKREIADASKGNFISKGLAVLQVTWFCVQLIARRVQGLAITPLEIGTAGFAVLCFVIYALWWNKPLDVDHSRRIEWKSGEPDENLHEDSCHRKGDFPEVLSILFSLFGSSMGNETLRVETFGGDDVNDDIKNLDDTSHTSYTWEFFKDQPGVFLRRFLTEPFTIVGLAAAFASTIFGLIHVAAWELLFPTRIEKVIWEVGATLIVSLPFAAPLSSFILALFGETLQEYKYATSLGEIVSVVAVIFLVVASPILYVVSRFALIVIMFTSLRDPSQSSFETIPWVELIPHL